MPFWSPEPVVSVRWFMLSLLIGLFLLPAVLNAGSSQSESVIELTYSLDRSTLPPLNDTDLTLFVAVGDARSISVFDESDTALPFEHRPESGEIMLTTTAAEITVVLTGASDESAVGGVRKADLRDGKKWAWSHSFDDNHHLEEPIGVLLEHGLPATLYVVGGWIDVGKPWSGDLTAVEIQALLDQGWSIGNHTLEHDNNCGEQPAAEFRRDSILQTDVILHDIIAGSSRPDYRVLSFAVPCGGRDRFRAYHEIVLDLRDEGASYILFTEGRYSDIETMNVSPPFNFDQRIKRDLRLDGSTDNGDAIKALFDSMSAGSGGPLWYNSYSHSEHLFGDNSEKLADVADYFVSTYGKNGSNEAWMAPADVIYSYLLVRDLTQVQLMTSVSTAATPVPTIKATATGVPVEIPATSTPQAANGGSNLASHVYLPYIGR